MQNVFKYNNFQHLLERSIQWSLSICHIARGTHVVVHIYAIGRSQYVIYEAVRQLLSVITLMVVIDMSYRMGYASYCSCLHQWA